MHEPTEYYRKPKLTSLSITKSSKANYQKHTILALEMIDGADLRRLNRGRELRHCRGFSLAVQFIGVVAAIIRTVALPPQR